MIERLQAVIATLETLSPEQQEQAAVEFESWLSDQHWDAW
jgi:flagellar motor switch protein FliG